MKTHYSPKRKQDDSQTFRFEKLEDRNLLAANLFVDFGDNFPAGTLTTTQGAFRDVANDPMPNNRILGTQLNDGSGAFNAGTQLDIVAQTFTATQRAQMMAVVERAFAPLDVNVVELTEAAQTTVDGRNVAGAASMTDVINTLRGGNAAWRDAYIFVGTFIVDPGGANQQIYTGGGGLSPGSPVLGVQSDLVGASNLHDDVAVVYSSGGFSNNTLNNISHEAGHLLGLRHSITNPAISATTNLLHQAEIMSYRNTNNTTSSMFARYPMIRGDGNSPGFTINATINAGARTITRAAGDFTTEGLVVGQQIRLSRADSNNGVFTIQNIAASVLTLTAAGTLTNDAQSIRVSWGPLNPNDIVARNGEVTIHDQLRMDANVLAATNTTFVSGTGAHDIITIARNGANADVTIQAFADAGYTTPVTVPGEADGTFSYSIPLTNTILVYAGDSNDRIVVDGDLGVDVRIDGMLGTDTLMIDGKGAANALYTPNMTAPVGVDLVNDFGGTMTIGGNSIMFNNFEANASTVTIQDVVNLRMVTPNGEDDIELVDGAAGRSRIDGSSGGVGFVEVEYDDITSVVLDVGVNDAIADRNDLVELVDNFIASGLTNFTVMTGEGNDSFNLTNSNLALPVGGGTFLFDGGVGNDLLNDNSGSNNLFVVDGTNQGTLNGLLDFHFVENLEGDSAVDTFRFAGGELDGQIVGESDQDVFDFATGSSQSVMLTADTADGFNGVVAFGSLVGSGFEGIDVIMGSNAGTTDQLAGLDSPNSVWTLNNNNDSYMPGSGGLLSFTDFDIYNGGSQTDTFDVLANNRPLTVNGQGGMDFLENSTGGSGLFVVDGANQGTFNTLLNFMSTEHLEGDSVDDEFRFINTGLLTGSIDGNGGPDHFNFSAMNSQTINLASAGIDGFDGNVDGGGLLGDGFEDIDKISGSTADTTDAVNGLDSNSLWTINNNADSYDDLLGNVLDLMNIDTFNGGNNIDTFEVFATNREVNLNGFGDNDFFMLSSGVPSIGEGDVSDINGDVNIDGGAGANRLTVVDFASAGNLNAEVTSNSITGLAPATINYASTGGTFANQLFPDQLNGIWIIGSDTAADRINVTSFLADNTLKIDGGGGSDTITTGVDALGDMHLDGQGDPDIVEVQLIDDTRRVIARDTGVGGGNFLRTLGLTTADGIVVRATSVSRNVTDRVWYDANTTNLAVLSRGGDDVINFAASDAAFFSIQTGNGDDFIQVIDTGLATQLFFLTGRHNDVVRVEQTAAGSATNVLTQAGNDRVFVGSNKSMNNGSLDRILGSLSLNGAINDPGGIDRLYINDNATLTGQIYGIDDNSVTALSPRAFTTLSHQMFEVVALAGTNEADEFVVTPTALNRFVIEGQLPTRHDINCAEEGDFLNLVADTSSGRKLTFTDRDNGNGFWNFTNGFQGIFFTGIERFNHVERLALGSDAFAQSLVNVLDAETREFMFSISPFEPVFTGGVRVATGDVNTDGIPDIITAAGAGRAPEIRIFDGVDGQFIDSFLAYGIDLFDGVLVAAGDVSGHCGVDLVTTTGPGRAKGEVRVWENTGTGFQLVDQFLPFGQNFYGGADVTVGDFNDDGFKDIATGALHGRGHVAVFDGSQIGGNKGPNFDFARFQAFGNDFYGGVHVSAGNVMGSNAADLIVSTGHNNWDSNFNSLAHVYDGTNLAFTPGIFDPADFLFRVFESGDESDRASTRVTVKDYDMDGMIDELFGSQGPNGNAGQIRVFQPLDTNAIDSFFEFDPSFDRGVFVG